MSYKSHRLAPERVFDHLYDPMFATSGEKDVWRKNNVALTTSAPINIFPVFQTMFTDLPRHPRNYYMMQRNPLPHLIPYYQPKEKTKSAPIVVGGQDRAKFFCNSVSTANNKKNLKKSNGDVNKDCHCASVAEVNIEVPAPTFATIACQTRYREQSAQTKPWMPDAFIGDPRAETPEIVHVAHMLRADVDGTPPGPLEAEIILRARKRRQWERALPPITASTDWEQRRAVLEAFEWEEWLGREQNLEYCQRIRLEIVDRMMADRKHKMERDSKTNINEATERLNQQKEAKLLKIRTKHDRRIRILTAERNGISKKYRPMDVATEHIDRASNLYGPLMRFGVHPKHRHFVANKTQYAARLDALHSMQTRPLNMKRFIEPRKDLTKPKGPIKEVKQGLWTDKYLQYLYESLKALRFKKVINTELAECLTYIKQESFEHLSTPNDSLSNISGEQDYQMALTLQRLIKGRAVQSMIFKGRDQYREFIAELQTTHQLSSVQDLHSTNVGAREMTDNRVYAYEQQQRVVGLFRARAQIDEVLEQAKGTTMGSMLDLLDKEMVRLTDQKRAHALCMLAEKERYKREAAEGGLRQVAENRRRENEAIHRHETVVRQNVATEYLEKFLLEGSERAAEQDGREQIRKLVQQIDMEAASILDPSSADVVSTLLDRVIVPDIMKQAIRVNYVEDIQRSIFGRLIKQPPYLQRHSDGDDSSLSSLGPDETIAEHEVARAIRGIIDMSICDCDPPTTSARSSQDSDDRYAYLTGIDENIWTMSIAGNVASETPPLEPMEQAASSELTEPPPALEPTSTSSAEPTEPPPPPSEPSNDKDE